MMFKVMYNRYGMIVEIFRIFEKSTDRIANENVKVDQYEANGSWELE